jgi:hypothetical protein
MISRPLYAGYDSFLLPNDDMSMPNDMRTIIG